jgi:hypothetical protein
MPPYSSNKDQIPFWDFYHLPWQFQKLSESSFSKKVQPQPTKRIISTAPPPKKMSGNFFLFNSKKEKQD